MYSRVSIYQSRDDADWSAAVSSETKPISVMKIRFVVTDYRDSC